MKWGTRYGPEYVNRLFHMVQRHMSGELGKDYRFICITDDVTGLADGIETKPLPPINDQLPPNMKSKPWLKLMVTDATLFDIEGDILFFDVDLIITGPIDDFFTYEPECSFVVIYNWTEPGKNTGNTSVFRLKVGSHPYLFKNFLADPAGMREKYKISQRYMSRNITEMKFWPDSWCQSFKENILPPWPQRIWKTPQLPEDARVVVFHGKPDPDEARDGRWGTKPWQGWKRIYKQVRPTPWIAEHWQ